ncbi:MAG TPA: cytochrome ubiquinol oxidase subunit I [Candidatus Limnocylindria bacterium]|nr:cytochrome ubiquinol oxidase subunit I [Candidatus Limnocylindria bacterium]
MNATAVAEGNLLLARSQMAFTLGFHIVVACLGVGFPVLMLIAEGLAIRTGDPTWYALARRWSKSFAVLFAVGAVSGTVLSFELGLLWPSFMGTFGAVIGLPFTLEGFAFFLEAIFVGIYLYGWDRLSPRAHWWAGVPIVLSGLASAWFVVTANAWMNSPEGFVLTGGVVTSADPLRAMLNQATPAQTAHMIVAAYMVSGFLVASVYAGSRLRGRNGVYHRRAMALGLTLGAVFAPIQIVVGDLSAKMVARTQPVKLAAMEGQFRTGPHAPLRIGGLPDEVTGQTNFALEIPGGLSWLAYGESSAVVRGLDSFPTTDWPPVALVHVAFQLMVGTGVALFALAVWSAWAAWRRRALPDGRGFLLAVVAAGPLAVLALEAGWVVTEVGRQPWIVQGVMRTTEAVTRAPGIGVLFTATLATYSLLGAGAVLILRLLAREPVPPARLEATSHAA